MHAPAHLFCSGVDSFDRALAAAAWAGYCAAQGDTKTAEKWAERASQENGKPFLAIPLIGGAGTLEVRVVRGEPDVRSLTLLRGMLDLHIEARREPAPVCDDYAI